MKKKIENSFVRRKDHVVWKAVDRKGILLNLEDGSYFDVDCVGLAIWELCDGRKKPEEIALRVHRSFRADPVRVSKDVSRFIGELKRRRLLELVSRPTAAIKHA